MNETNIFPPLNPNVKLAIETGGKLLVIGAIGVTIYAGNSPEMVSASGMVIRGGIILLLIGAVLPLLGVTETGGNSDEIDDR